MVNGASSLVGRTRIAVSIGRTDVSHRILTTTLGMGVVVEKHDRGSALRLESSARTREACFQALSKAFASRSKTALSNGEHERAVVLDVDLLDASSGETARS